MQKGIELRIEMNERPLVIIDSAMLHRLGVFSGLVPVTPTAGSTWTDLLGIHKADTNGLRVFYRPVLLPTDAELDQAEAEYVHPTHLAPLTVDEDMPQELGLYDVVATWANGEHSSWRVNTYSGVQGVVLDFDHNDWRRLARLRVAPVSLGIKCPLPACGCWRRPAPLDPAESDADWEAENEAPTTIVHHWWDRPELVNWAFRHSGNSTYGLCLVHLPCGNLITRVESLTASIEAVTEHDCPKNAKPDTDPAVVQFLSGRRG